MQPTPKFPTRLALLVVSSFLVATSFFSGFTLSTMLTQREETQKMNKVTGIGGVFFKCKDPKALREWYGTHLGLTMTPYGSTFAWFQGADSTKHGYTQWSPFKETTNYFEPSTKDFMSITVLKTWKPLSRNYGKTE